MPAMLKAEILASYHKLNDELYSFLAELSPAEAQAGIAGKWSVNQNLLHLNKVLVPLNKALAKPKFLLRYAFGKPNREGRSYEGLEKRYHEKAQGPAKAPEVYQADSSVALSQDALIKEYQQLMAKLLSIVDRKWSEKQLDSYLLAHPLLGKLTIREILYFVHWHTNHHFKAMKKIRD